MLNVSETVKICNGKIQTLLFVSISEKLLEFYESLFLGVNV